MWSPTHVQVTVQRARGLPIKGKGGTNDCFVTIALGKDKFQTSVKEKCAEAVEWREECDLVIPAKGNTAEVVLTAYHRNFVTEQFLGQVSVPLANFDVYETPRNKWYRLENKPGKDNSKERGEIEVKIGFTVKEDSPQHLDKKDRHKSSMGQLSQAAHSLGGSLMSLGGADKRRGLKKFAKNLGSKINLNKKDKSDKSDKSPTGSAMSVEAMGAPRRNNNSNNNAGSEEADPGVISEDEDEFAFDDLSHKSSGSSLNVGGTLPRRTPVGDIGRTAAPVPTSLENLGGGELLRRSTSGGRIGPAPERTPPPPKPVRLGLDDLTATLPRVAPPPDGDEWSRKLHAKAKVQSQLLLERETAPSPAMNKSVENLAQLKKDSPRFFKKFGGKDKDKAAAKARLGERIIVGEEGLVDEAKLNPAYEKIPREALKEYERKSREELVVRAWSLQNELDGERKKVKDLENYLDELLLRVMETTPRILQNPYGEKNGIYLQK